MKEKSGFFLGEQAVYCIQNYTLINVWLKFVGVKSEREKHRGKHAENVPLYLRTKPIMNRKNNNSTASDRKLSSDDRFHRIGLIFMRRKPGSSDQLQAGTGLTSEQPAANQRSPR